MWASLDVGNNHDKFNDPCLFTVHLIHYGLLTFPHTHTQSDIFLHTLPWDWINHRWCCESTDQSLTLITLQGCVEMCPPAVWYKLKETRSAPSTDGRSADGTDWNVYNSRCSQRGSGTGSVSWTWRGVQTYLEPLVKWTDEERKRKEFVVPTVRHKLLVCLSACLSSVRPSACLSVCLPVRLSDITGQTHRLTNTGATHNDQDPARQETETGSDIKQRRQTWTNARIWLWSHHCFRLNIIMFASPLEECCYKHGEDFFHFKSMTGSV